MYKIRYFRSFSELPETYKPLLENAAKTSLFYDRDWLELMAARGFEEQDELRLYAVEDAITEQPALLIPMCYSILDSATPYAQSLATMSHPENYSIMCLMFGSSDQQEYFQILVSLFKHLKRRSRTELPECFDSLRLCPLETGSELARIIHTALQKSGFWVQSFTNSFNRYENTTGKNYDDYLATRSANFRYNIRRRKRNLEKNNKVEFTLYCDNNNLPDGITDYIAVTRASWKSPITMISDGILDLIRLAANKKCLRLGILHVNDKAVAAQFWIVSGDTASCLRLAYDEAYKNHSVGVVLTNDMIAHFLNQDRVDYIDFGYGEEEYKGQWMKDYRYYLGYLAFNPSTRRGLYFGIKHIAGRPLKRSIKWAYKLLISGKRKSPDKQLSRQSRNGN